MAARGRESLVVSLPKLQVDYVTQPQCSYSTALSKRFENCIYHNVGSTINLVRSWKNEFSKGAPVLIIEQICFRLQKTKQYVNQWVDTYSRAQLIEWGRIIDPIQWTCGSEVKLKQMELRGIVFTECKENQFDLPEAPSRSRYVETCCSTNSKWL